MRTGTLLLVALGAFVLATARSTAQLPIVFQPPVGFPPCVGSGPIEMGDVDLDGMPDVTIGTPPPYNQVCVLRNTGFGGFAPGTVIATGPGFSRAKLVDLDDDGDPEMVTTHFNPGSFRILVNLGGGPGSVNFAPPSAPYPLGTVGVNDVAWGDFDGDLDLDLAFIAYSGTYPSYVMSVATFINVGACAFVPGMSFSTPDALALAAGDFDGDGDPDLAYSGTAGMNPAYVAIRWNDGTGSFGAPAPLTAPGTQLLTRLHAVDADDDGDVDLIGGYDSIWIWTNGPGGMALSPVYPPGPPVPVAGQWHDADFNCDGHRDYVISSNTNGHMYLITGGPSGPSAPVALGYQGYSLASGEMNHDAQLDLVCYREFGVSTMLNDSFTYCFAKDGLLSRVNSSPWSKELKVIHAGDTVSWKTDVSHKQYLKGRPAAIFVNVPPESGIIAYTPITGLIPVPGFECVHFLSVPAGPAYLTGDSLYLGTINIAIDLGFGPLAMGDPAYSLTVPPGLMPVGEQVRMQAIFYDPHPNNWWIITPTNPIRLEMGP